MSWKTPLMNIKYRNQAATTMQANPRDCTPFWFRNTDYLWEFIINPLSEVNGTLTFRIWDPVTEQPTTTQYTVNLLDNDGSTIFTDLPSTILDWVNSPTRPKDRYCFTLFTKTFAEASGFAGSRILPDPNVQGSGGEGKWPRTAGE